MTDATGNPDGDGPDLRGVSKRFGAVQALTDIELDVRRRRGGRPGRRQRRRASRRWSRSSPASTAPTTGTMSFDGRQVQRRAARPRRSTSASPPSSRTSPCATTSTSSPTSSSAASSGTGRALDEVDDGAQSWELLHQLSAKIPSVRIPVATLSGGQRQTVAIARSLLGEPKVVMLDEPTAALGVAQTAEVLNLVERLRDRGLGVILISHNMADVQAVADRIAVLRLGRNNGVFDVSQTKHRRTSSPRSPARPTTPSRSAPRVGAGGTIS